MYSPVVAERVDLEQIERELVELVAGDSEWVPAASLGCVLGVERSSATYREVVERLKERGWVWACRRVEGKAVKVIVRPCGV